MYNFSNSFKSLPFVSFLLGTNLQFSLLPIAGTDRVIEGIHPKAKSASIDTGKKCIICVCV